MTKSAGIKKPDRILLHDPGGQLMSTGNDFLLPVDLDQPDRPVPVAICEAEEVVAVWQVAKVKCFLYF